MSLFSIYAHACGHINVCYVCVHMCVDVCMHMHVFVFVHVCMCVFETESLDHALWSRLAGICASRDSPKPASA